MKSQHDLVYRLSTCGAVVKRIRVFCRDGPNIFRAEQPTFRLVWKAKRTTMVLTRRQDRHRTKLIPNAACRSRHFHRDGCPRNNREHKKQSFSDRSSKKLISELLALTIGVERKRWKMIVRVNVRMIPSRVRMTRMMPMVSEKDRNSSTPGKHFTLSLSGK